MIIIIVFILRGVIVGGRINASVTGALVPWRHGDGLAFVSGPGAFGDVVGDPSEKTVMFLNVPFSRETAVLSGMSDEPKRRSPLRRGVLPRWQPPG